VGLGYLSLGRSASSLSSGESQRIRLATQIGSKLREKVPGTCEKIKSWKIDNN
jgi:excinuclease UvrABC ATPase subunit